MSYETLIDEPVKVWAFFDPSTEFTLERSEGLRVNIFPIAMNWRYRLIKFQKLIFASSKKIGEVKIFNLVCASETTNFELEYNTQNHLWKLKRIMPKS